MSNYTITTTTQTSNNADTDSKVTIRLWGTKGRSLFRRLNTSENDFEKGDTNVFNQGALEDVGEVFKIDISVGNDGWLPDRIKVRYNINGKTSIFSNFEDVFIDGTTRSFYADNLVSIDMQSGFQTYKEHVWYGFDYRDSNTPQSISRSDSTKMIRQIANDTERNLAVETGFTITNESSVESGSKIGPTVKASVKSEFYGKLATEIKKKVHLEQTSIFEENTQIEFTVPEATLLLVKYEVDTENQIGTMTFFEGTKREVIVPVYNRWSLSEIPKERIEITSDSQMTQEYKDIYKEVFGKEWKSKPFAH